MNVWETDEQVQGTDLNPVERARNMATTGKLAEDGYEVLGRRPVGAEPGDILPSKEAADYDRFWSDSGEYTYRW